MKILGIETSCDETAVCIIDCRGNLQDQNLKIEILGNALHSQVESHKKFGGVVPMMAKREHAKNLIPLFLDILKKTNVEDRSSKKVSAIDPLKSEKLNEIFGREIEFKDNFIQMISKIEKLNIDAIAVTTGPGLEPALWMGIIFAEALGFVFDIPIIPVNHMEGHIMSVLPSLKKKKINFPIISLLISGGHTELVLMKDWHSYEILGETRDDAVGEAFDKVARMLGLPYPGGPHISSLAEIGRTKTSTIKYILPRPMINSKDYDFSFSGLKTAVFYSLKERPPNKEIVAKEFEEAVTDVLISKTMRAVEEYGAKTLIIGGGVVSNKYIRNQFKITLKDRPEIELLIPEETLRTDNAIMIGIAGYLNFLKGIKDKKIKAFGTLRLN